MKIQVNLSNELLEKLDYICKSLGVSRSAFCALWIGRKRGMSYGKASRKRLITMKRKVVKNETSLYC